MKPPFPDWDWYTGVGGGGGDATPTLLGITQGSTAGNTVVILYPAGSHRNAGATITVEILGLLPTEVVPDGVWINGIGKFTDADKNIIYQATLPIWL